MTSDCPIRRAQSRLIKITYIEKEGNSIFSIEDNGSGIPKEQIDNIFEIYHIAHKLKNIDSTGIGLALVKRIITHLGGSIWVESNLGKGTTFHFNIPIIQSEKGLAA